MVSHFTHRLLSSSFLGLPYRSLNMNHKEELLLRSLWVLSGFFFAFQDKVLRIGVSGLRVAWCTESV